MSKNKFTPGPWDLKNGCEVFGPLGGDSGDGSRCEASDGWKVAEVGYYDSFVDGELTALGEEPRKANAKLICAAPDMLEVLQSLENDAGQMPDFMWQAVQKVIAKATGATDE